MSRHAEDRNRRMLRARDGMDRDFAAPLDVAAVAGVAHVSPSHFNREFQATFGERPPTATCSGAGSSGRWRLPDQPEGDATPRRAEEGGFGEARAPRRV